MAAVAAVPQLPPAETADDAWREASWLPCQLHAEIFVQGFTMGDLMRIEVGSIVDSGIAIEKDVDVSVNGACVGCGKLDLAGERLALRVTELV